MNPSSSDRDPLEVLAEEFVDRYRRGERPSMREFAQKHPDLAEQIRDLFPALVAMEEFGSVGGPANGPALPRPAADHSTPGQLGEYRILREVGRGGMGVVYEAVQESLGRHVALKVLPFHGSISSVHLERFRREVQAAAKLHHTNIVSVFGVGEHHGIHYYAMQFIRGQGLDSVLGEVKRLRRGTVPPALPPHRISDTTGASYPTLTSLRPRGATARAPRATASAPVPCALRRSSPRCRGTGRSRCT